MTKTAWVCCLQSAGDSGQGHHKLQPLNSKFTGPTEFTDRVKKVQKSAGGPEKTPVLRCIPSTCRGNFSLLKSESSHFSIFYYKNFVNR